MARSKPEDTSMPLTYSRRRQPKPIESVELKISFRADEETSAKIREALPNAEVRQGKVRLVVEGEKAGEVAERAREMVEKLRTLFEKPKT